jgi:pimeloyl-ACP methyl ester carboxylesterase
MEKRIRLSSHSVNVQFLGSGHGQTPKPVLIFLHEALGSIVQWKQFPFELCERTGLPGIVIERRGHGKSDPLTQQRTADYLHAYTDELQEVLKELLPLNTPVILIGHSDGGTIALLFARFFPKNVTAIVTMAAHTFVEPETLAGIHPAVTAYENGKLEGLKRIHGDKTDDLFYAWADTWRAPFFTGWDIREEIKGIQCPALIMQGTNDQYGTFAQVESIAAALTNAQTFLVTDCGHHPHLEKPSEVLAETERFIRSLS